MKMNATARTSLLNILACFFLILALALSSEPAQTHEIRRTVSQCSFHEKGAEQLSVSSDINQEIIRVEMNGRRLVPSKQCQSHDSLNFGVLVNNPYFKIYRSSGLGLKGLRELETHLDGANHPGNLPSTIIYMNHYAYGKISEKVVNYFIRRYNKYKDRPNFAYYDFAKEQEKVQKFPVSQKRFAFHHPAGSTDENVYVHGKDPLRDLLETKSFSGMTANAKNKENEQEQAIFSRGGRDNLYHVLEKILSGPNPVLFHCKGGIHRTGMTALMVRYLQGDEWTRPWVNTDGKPQVLTLAVKSDGHSSTANIHHPAEYEYYLHNSHNFRQENLQAIHELSKDSRFQCLKEKFQKYLNEGDHDHDTKCGTSSPATSIATSITAEGQRPLSPKEFGQKAPLWIKECRDLFEQETRILVHLDYIEAAIKKNKYKIRLYEKGLSVSSQDKDKNEGDQKNNSGDYLLKTVQFFKDLKSSIQIYEKHGKRPATTGPNSPTLTMGMRLEAILEKLMRKDPSLKKAMNSL